MTRNEKEFWTGGGKRLKRWSRSEPLTACPLLMAVQPDRTVNVGAVTKLIVAYRNGQTSANGLGLKAQTTFYLHVVK